MHTDFPLVNDTFDEFLNTTLTYLITDRPTKDYIEYQYATLIRQYASIVICINDAICRLVNALWYGSSFGSTYFLFFATLDR